MHFGQVANCFLSHFFCDCRILNMRHVHPIIIGSRTFHVSVNTDISFVLRRPGRHLTVLEFACRALISRHNIHYRRYIELKLRP